MTGKTELPESLIKRFVSLQNEPWLKIESSGPIPTSWKPRKNEWTKEAADDLLKLNEVWPHLGKTPMRQLELF